MSLPLTPASTPRAWARSLRFRLTLWYTGVLAVILVGAAAAVFGGARLTLRTETDRYLRSEARRIAVVAAGRPGDPPDPEDLREAVSALGPARGTDPVYVRLVVRPGGPARAVSPDLARQPALTASLDGLLHGPPSGPAYFAFAGPDEERTARVLTTPVRLGPQPAWLQVAVPWDHNADILEHLGALLLAGVPAVLALAALGGWALVGSTLRPISRIVAEAERLDAADLPEALLPAAAETDGEIGHLVGTLNRMTLRLRRAFDAQRRFAEAQQRFAADASHELRTPLTILRGEMDLALSRPRAPEVYRATLASAVEEVAHLSRIVEGLSLLARRDAGLGDEGARRGDVDIGALCRTVAAEFGPQAQAKGVALRVEAGGKDGPAARGDADQLQQLLRNLVDNALKYTPPGGAVTVGAVRLDDGSAAVSVTDTGVGIAPDDVPRVFDRFWRADRSRTGAGHGLGLAICAEIARAHGGRIEVESEPGGFLKPHARNDVGGHGAGDGGGGEAARGRRDGQGGLGRE